MEKSYFFNSAGGDRKYTAEDWANYFNSFIGNGVFLSDAGALSVSAYSGRTVRIAAGKAWINGYAYLNTDNLDKTLDAATANRIDRIAVLCDFTARSITVVVKNGTYAATPVPPELIRTADVYELGIADVYMASGTTVITDDDITDLRGDTAYCGGAFLTVDRIELKSEISNAVASFTEAGTRTNIQQSDNAGTIFGKIKKWFADLKGLAFKDKIAAGDVAAGAIVNADIAATAAIASSKISGLGSLAAKSSIVNSDIASNAGIDVGKLSNFSSAIEAAMTAGGYEKKTLIWNTGYTKPDSGTTTVIFASYSVMAAGDVYEFITDCGIVRVVATASYGTWTGVCLTRVGIAYPAESQIAYYISAYLDNGTGKFSCTHSTGVGYTASANKQLTISRIYKIG
jgi:hypothetical protein